MHKLLFPQFADSHWMEINLDETVREYFRHRPDNPMIDPEFCDAWVNHLHRKLGVWGSYGGYGEHRGRLWEGSYLSKFIHLGVDFNPGSPFVHCVHDGVVREVWKDPDQQGGWGTRIIMDHDDKPSLIYAHLGVATVRKGQTVACGYPLGALGRPHENGGWYRHLHVQAFTGDIPADGYGDESDLANNPNPCEIFT